MFNNNAFYLYRAFTNAQTHFRSVAETQGKKTESKIKEEHVSDIEMLV